MLLKGSLVTGYEIADFERRRPEEAAQNRDDLEALLTSGKIVPPIQARYPLEEAVQAMAAVAGREKMGLTVLNVSPSR
ncbi:putative oxidoreductase [Gordonia amarae NBRC 15530]|uniref:Putative oxidoreductase n=1 Tax=Gordonia amarae NBRC 15530 TaxID=1075090 RepID=G7GMV7_9ACTN|nr:putative oxidoreductase [Gordonia amarae NBRC 15530]